MALTNAERLARCRERRQAGGFRIWHLRPADGGRGHSRGSTPPRRADRRYAPTGVSSAAATTKSVSSPRIAARADRPRRAPPCPVQTPLALQEQVPGVAGRVAGMPHRVGDRALLEQACNLDRCTLRTRDVTGGTGRISGARREPNGRDRPLNVAALRRAFHFAGIRVPHPRNACSTSPKCAASASRPSKRRRGRWSASTSGLGRGLEGGKQHHRIRRFQHHRIRRSASAGFSVQDPPAYAPDRETIQLIQDFTFGMALISRSPTSKQLKNMHLGCEASAFGSRARTKTST